MTDTTPTIWQLAEWPLDTTKKREHLFPEDVRRFIYLASIGAGRPSGHETFTANPYITSQNFALDFKDVLDPYPTSDLTYTTEQQETNVEWGDILPGSHLCYYDGSFTHDIYSVDLTSDSYGEFVFALGSQRTEPCLFDQTGTTIYITGVTKSWYEVEDDFRPGTPFIVNSTAENWSQENNGYYRVKSTRTSGSYLYVKVDYGEKAERKQLTTCSGFSGVEASCAFGGDWWIFRGNNGSSTDGPGDNTDLAGDLAALSDDGTNYTNSLTRSGYLWSKKDFYHRHPLDSGELIRSPYDGRPPTGGLLAADFNSDWIRTFNPAAYHTYDQNCHRYMVYADWQGNRSAANFDIYSAVFPAQDYLPFQTDPKEQIPPKLYRGDSSTKWKYNSKVQFKALQITDPANLGPRYDTIKTGYSTGTGDDDHHGRSMSKQYMQSHAVEYGGYGELTEAGYLPAQHATSAWGPQWQQGKFNGAIQNMIELICQSKTETIILDGILGGDSLPISLDTGFDGKTFMLRVDDDYIDNWLWFHANIEAESNHYDYMVAKYSMPTGNTTYGEILAWGGTAKAWRPDLNTVQMEWAQIDDVFWGENESGVELLLKKLGHDYYDWVFDTETPWTWSHVLNEKWEVEQDAGTYNGGSTVNGVSGLTNWDDNAEARYPTVSGTWRRTFKYSLGHYENVKITTGTSTDPCGMRSYWYGEDDIRMPGRSVVDYENMPDQESTADAYVVPDITDFGPNTYSCSVDGTTITISGDITANLKAGYSIWTVDNAALNAVDATTTEYLVKHVKYNGTNTIAILSGTLNQTTFYYDKAINDRHNADTGTPGYIYRVHLILDQCRDLLNLLTASVGAMTDHKLIAAYTDSTDTDWIEGFSYAHPSLASDADDETIKAFLLSEQNDNYDTRYPDDYDDWVYNPTYPTRAEIGHAWMYFKNVVTDSWYGTLAWYRAAIIVDEASYKTIFGTSPFESDQTTYILMRIKAAQHCTLPAVTFDADSGIYSNFEQQAHNPGFYDSVGNAYTAEYLYEQLEGTSSATVVTPYAYYYVPITAANVTGSFDDNGVTKKVIEFMSPWGATSGIGPQSGSVEWYNWSENVARPMSLWEADIKIENERLIQEFDWTTYNRVSWKRLYERASIVFGDLGDTTPPVPTVKFIKGPYLYDANLEWAGNGFSSYTDDDYVADWRIRAYANLVQDEAGHGVLYDFTAESPEDDFFSSIPDTFLAEMDSDDEGYLYDMALPTGYTYPTMQNYFTGTTGFFLDCAAHDNYSTISGGSGSDNYQDAVTSDELVLDNDTMFFPHQADYFEYDRTTPDGIHWRDEITIKLPWWNGAAGGRYQVEVTHGAGEPTVYTYSSRFYVGPYITGAVRTVHYRFRYYSHNRRYPGMWSDVLTIEHP